MTMTTFERFMVSVLWLILIQFAVDVVPLRRIDK